MNDSYISKQKWIIHVSGSMSIVSSHLGQYLWPHFNPILEVVCWSHMIRVCSSTLVIERFGYPRLMISINAFCGFKKSFSPALNFLQPTKRCKMHIYMWPGLRKLTMWVQKNRQLLACLLYHNFIKFNIYIIATKFSSLLQNLMGFLLQLSEMG